MRKYIVETQSPQDDKRMQELIESGALRVTEVTDPKLLYPELYTPVSPEEQERLGQVFDAARGCLSDEQAENLKARIYKDREEWRG